MLTHSKSGPLKVSLLTISPHNRAILEFFFTGAGRNLFKIVSVQEAEAFIVDYDHPGAREDWEKHRATQKAGIILSVHAVDLPNTVWVAKPLTSKALTEAVDKVHALPPAAPPPASQPLPEAVEPKPAPPPPERPFVRDLPPITQPFGLAGSAARKPRRLVIDLPDDEDDTPPAVASVPASTAAPLVGIFDPAETTIPMEEIDRPVEPSISPEQAEQRWKQLCGAREDIASPSAWHLEAMLYTPENYLLTNVLDALRLSQQSKQTVQIKLSADDYVLLMPESNFAYCTLDTRSDEFTMLCNNPVQTAKVALHIPSNAELLPLEEHAEKDAECRLDLEAFIWTTSLLTAQGRLGRGVDVNQKVALKHWPNMTRLEQFPHVMRIAALWHQRPGTLFEIAKALNVPQRHVISFYTAASTLNLFELDQSKLKSREKEAPKQNRGLFSRLLKRLLGGGGK